MVRDDWDPPMPHMRPDGTYEAVTSARVILARKVLRLRRRAGLTSFQVANLAGVHPDAVVRLETARPPIDLPRTLKIIHALEKKIEEKKMTDSASSFPPSSFLPVLTPGDK